MGEHTATVQCQGTGGCTAMGEQAAPDATPNVIMAKEYLLWTAGLQILLNAEIAMLRDKQLGKALAHHRFVVKQPDTWYWDEQTKQYSKIAAIVSNHYHNKGSHFLDFENLEPPDRAGEIWQLHPHLP